MASIVFMMQKVSRVFDLNTEIYPFYYSTLTRVIVTVIDWFFSSLVLDSTVFDEIFRITDLCVVPFPRIE